MVFDQSNLKSDQHYLSISELLMGYQVNNYSDKSTNSTKNVPFKELVTKASINRVGRLLPYYWIEYDNGIIAIVWYEVLNKQLTVIALLNPNILASLSSPTSSATKTSA
jgi:hypothetical protein